MTVFDVWDSVHCMNGCFCVWVCVVGKGKRRRGFARDTQKVNRKGFNASAKRDFLGQAVRMMNNVLLHGVFFVGCIALFFGNVRGLIC